MKICISVHVESDKPLNSVAQKAKVAAEDAVIEVISQLQSNQYVHSSVQIIDD
jgi:hypothetical protein